MGRGLATSEKLRKIIVKKYHEGKSMRKISEELDIAKSTVGGIIKRFGETASFKVGGKSTGRPVLITPRCSRLLVKICKKGRRSSLRDITAQWNVEAGLNVSRECCRKWIHKSGLGFYKVNSNWFKKN